MNSIVIFVRIEGKQGGARRLSILREDVEKDFEWLSEQVEASRLPGFGNANKLYVRHFCTGTGKVVPWTDLISEYIHEISMVTPLVIVAGEKSPMAVQVIPESVQENLAVIAQVVRDRSAANSTV